MSELGRPTKWQDDFVEQANKLCALGATDKKIANFFNISESTLNAWKAQKPEFLESIKRGKENYDNETIEASLLKRAKGLEVREVRTNHSTGEVVETVKDLPPDTTAMIFWLKNRQPNRWRDKAEVSHKVPSVSPIEIMDALRRKHQK